jgi:cytochrome c-type biogenesis protein CcmH
MIVEGKSDEEIKHFLVSRYSDFVLYQPPFKSTTYLLWLLPPILLLISLWILRLFIRQQVQPSLLEFSEEEQQKIRQALKE